MVSTISFSDSGINPKSFFLILSLLKKLEKIKAITMAMTPCINIDQDGPICCDKLPSIKLPSGNIPKTDIAKKLITRPRIFGAECIWINVRQIVV